MITLNIDKNSDAAPLYVQIYNQIREKIINQEIVAHERMPSKRALASHLNVSLKTIENAYFQLALEGYIYSEEKVGYFAENLEGYRKQSDKPQPYATRYQDEKFKVDVKANKTPVHLFPLSTWFRMGREAMTEQGEKLLETVPFNGVFELRQAIARHLKDFRGMDVSSDQIVIGSGTEYLYWRLLKLFAEDRIVALDDPSSNHIKTVLHNSGVPWRAVPMDKNGMMVDDLNQSACNLAHVNPMAQFPMGTIMPVQRRVDLLKWANQKPGRYIVEHDYNCEYLYQGHPVPSIYSIDTRQRVIYMNTFSKTVSPALRIAYMVLPEQLMDRYLQTNSFYACSVSALEQHQLAKFISGGCLERHVRKVTQFNLAQRAMVLQSILESEKRGRVEVLDSPVGTHFLCRLDTKLDDAALLEHLSSKDILASFVSQYCYSPKPEFDHLLIVNYSSVTADQMAYLVKNLAL